MIFKYYKISGAFIYRPIFHGDRGDYAIAAMSSRVSFGSLLRHWSRVAALHARASGASASTGKRLSSEML